jgi:hypothetical protein
MKKTTSLLAAALFVITTITVFGREARLVRYPNYHNGRIVFTYRAISGPRTKMVRTFGV